MNNRRNTLSLLALALSVTGAGAFTVVVDPPSLTKIFDNFNDGASTATNFNNMTDGGEAGGFSSVTMPAGAGDPQFQYLTPGAPFSAATFPFMRVGTRGSVGGGSQIFPLPAAGGTVLNYSTATGFTESQLQFVPPVNGTGLRFDPLGGGTGGTETFDFDYIMLDRFQTIGVGEFDHDGALDGWTLSGNGHIINNGTSAITSTLMGTTNGVDPVMQRAGLNIDTGLFNIIEISMALDPASSSRFEMFWGTSTFGGPAAGQSVVLVNELVRDGNLHTYRIDMTDEAAWDGSLNILRIDPLADADAAAGRMFEIDYVRLTAGPVPEPSAVMLALSGLGLLLARRRR